MKILHPLLAGLLFFLTPLTGTPVMAAPGHQVIACEQDYIVPADDWLSKLAGKFYGDIFAYPAIVAATNLAAAADDSYTVIDNPDLIEIGQKLCIPSAEAGDTAENEGPTFTFQFETDDEGWVTGFADLPADSNPEFYQLGSG